MQSTRTSGTCLCSTITMVQRQTVAEGQLLDDYQQKRSLVEELQQKCQRIRVLIWKAKRSKSPFHDRLLFFKFSQIAITLFSYD